MLGFAQSALNNSTYVARISGRGLDVENDNCYSSFSSSVTSSEEGVSSAGMRLVSLAHSPKSINLQRSEQKGRKALSGRQVFFWPQLGQTMLGDEVFGINTLMNYSTLPRK